MVEKVLQLLRGLAAQAGENVEFGAAASLAGPFTKGTPVITVKPNSAPVGPAPAAARSRRSPSPSRRRPPAPRRSSGSRLATCMRKFHRDSCRSTVLV